MVPLDAARVSVTNDRMAVHSTKRKNAKQNLDWGTKRAAMRELPAPLKYTVGPKRVLPTLTFIGSAHHASRVEP